MATVLESIEYPTLMTGDTLGAIDKINVTNIIIIN